MDHQEEVQDRNLRSVILFQKDLIYNCGKINVHPFSTNQFRLGGNLLTGLHQG